MSSSPAEAVRNPNGIKIAQPGVGALSAYPGMPTPNTFTPKGFYQTLVLGPIFLELALF